MVSFRKIFIFSNMHKFYYFEFSAGRVDLTRLPKAIQLSAKHSNKTAEFLSASYLVQHRKKLWLRFKFAPSEFFANARNSRPIPFKLHLNILFPGVDHDHLPKQFQR